jgi:gliding motility-associated-like protein
MNMISSVVTRTGSAIAKSIIKFIKCHSLSVGAGFVLTLLTLTSVKAQTQFWSDTFEDSGAPSAGTRTPSINTGFPGVPYQYYFMRTDGTNLALQAPFTNLPPSPDDPYTTYQNVQGSKFWAGEDTDRARTGVTDVNDKVQQIEWNGIDISGKSGLSFKGLFAAHRSMGWQNPVFGPTYDFLMVEYKIDGGSWTKAGGFYSDLSATNAGFLREDTNGDLTGDGAYLTKTFQEFGWAITGTGTTLSLRFKVSADGSATQEFAVDNFRLFSSNSGPAASPGNVEYFEGATAAAQTFTNAATGLNFTLGNKLAVQNYTGYGINAANPPSATTGSNFYIGNDGNTGTGQVNTIKTTNKTPFAVKTMWVYPSANASGTPPTNGGTVTFTGKKNGVTQYTFNKTGIFQTSVSLGTNYNGFALVDFSVGTDNSSTLIDELEITLGGGFQYLAIDNFAFTATPSITNTAATSVTGSTATLNASVNPSNAATSAISFDYSTSSTLALGVVNVAASPASLTASASATSVSANITGLNGGTTYYYRAKGTNSIGTNDNSPILNFTTTSGVLLSTSPTLTFTSSAGMSSMAVDGNGTSSAISDLDLQVFAGNKTTGAYTAGTTMRWENASYFASGNGFNGITPGPDPGITSTGFSALIIKSSSQAANFSLKSIQLQDWGAVGPVQIAGYNNGTLVGAVSLSLPANGDGVTKNQAGELTSAYFNDIDEVRIYSTTVNIWVGVNNIQIGSPVAAPVNNAPVIGGTVASQAVNDNATISPFSAVTITDAQTVQTQSVSVTLDAAAKGSFTTLSGFTNAGSGVYTFSGTAAAAQTAIRGLVFTPTANRVAPASTETTTFTISVNDGVAAAVTNATTTVVSTSINDAPVAVADSYSLNNGATLTVSSPNLLTNDTDPENSAMTAVLITGPTNGTLTLNANGTFTYVHNGSATTSDSFTYKASDGSLTSTTTTVTLTINPAPVTVSSIDRVEAAVTNATTVNYTVTFSTAVTGVDAGDFTLTKTGTANGAIGTPTGSGATWTVPINTVAGAGTLRLDFTSTTGVTPNVTANFTTGQVYTIDQVAPTLTSGSYFSNNGSSSQYAKVGDVVTLSIGFNEALQSNVIAIAGHTVTATGSNGNKNWTATYTLASGDTEGNVPWSFSATDLAGNIRQQTNTDYGTVLIFDKTGPTINITPTATIVAPSANAAFNIAYVDANFNTSTLTSGHITVSATGTAAYTSLSLTGTGTAYVATLNGVSGSGTLGISIAAGTATDIPGNNAGASGASPTVLIASNNADLSALTTTATGLSPTFSAATVAYTANVPYATTSTTVTATKAHAGATLQVSVNGAAYTTLTSGTASGALALNVGSNTIDVLVTAENGITNKLYTLTVTRVNVAPTNLALSSSAINENVAANSTVGALSTTDTDVGNAFTYSLVAGTGDTDNAAFTISGSDLTINAAPDFETKSSYSVRIRTTDQSGLTFEKAFAITITNLNEAPTALALSGSSVNENVSPNTTIGLLSTTDADAANTFTYSLVAGTDDTDNSSFNISGGLLRITGSPNYEAINSYSIRVRTTDQGGLSFEKVFTITINNVNEEPFDMALSASSINENVAAGSTVGSFSSTDLDASNTFTYSFVSGTGSTDNGSFTISGNSLKITSSPDYEIKNSYSIRVRTTDQGGLTYDKVFSIAINDVTELIFNTTTLNTATVATSFSQQINVTVGASPYTFAVTAGVLPAGLTLSTSGLLSGTPTAGGNFNFTLTATDQNSVSASYAYSLTVGAPTLALTASLPNGMVNTAYSQTIATTGGTSPYAYAVTIGALPPGLTLSSAGALTGTPTLGGMFNFTVKTTDASTGSGPYSTTKAYALVIDPTGQMITFAASASKTYGDADFNPAATSTNSSIAITYSSSDPTIATIVSGKVHIVKAGTVTISADQAADASYTAAVQKQQTLTINPKTLTVSLTGTVSKTYNNSSSATLTASNFSLAGKVGADDVSIAVPVTGAYNTKTVGTSKVVSVTGLALAGAEQANYQLASTSANAAIGVILVKSITVTLNASPLVTKVYDRTTAATLAAQNYSLVGIETGDDVTVNGTATYDNTIVGTGKVVTAGSFALSGTDKDNYSLTTTTATTTGAITAKPITVALNAVPTITKIYDGLTTAALATGNYTLAGIQLGDVVTISGTATYDTKIVATGKTITATTFVLAGADKNNYNLTTTTATTTGSITAKPITLTLNANPAITKVYDATNSATLVAGNYSLTGLTSGDDVAVTGTATYNSKTVGTGKVVTAGSFVLSGTDKDNYNLTTTTATTTGDITGKPITVALNAAPAITKVYDGNTTASLVAGNYTLTGVQVGDVVTVTGTTAYDTRTAGTGKTVTATTFVLAGADKDNYSVSTTTATTTGSITTKPITLALNAAPTITKVYDGNNSATLAAGNYSLIGLVGSDIVTVTGTTNYDNAAANTGKIITATAFVLGGGDKDNYNLTTSTATSTGAITKAPLVITADNKTRVQNTPDPTFTATYTGFVNSETNAILTTQPTFTTTATLSSLQGDYLIVPAGAAAQNYTISYVNGTLTVTPGVPKSITLAQATLFENRPVGTVTGTLSSTSDDPNATFTYTLVSGTGDTDNSLFAIAGAQLNTASSLNYEQKASYSVRVRSTTQYGLSLERVLTIALSDVNEQPTLTDIANQTLCADGDRKTVNLTGISAGPETSQTTSLTIASTNASLFSELAVTNAGVLTYKTANGKSGSATVTVTVKDNGGTNNGGVDNYSRSFTITVNPLPLANITTDGGKITLSKGETLTLRASGGTTYNWVNAPGIIGARNSDVLTIRPEATTTYTVEVISASGCSVTKSITITVNEDFVVVKGTNLLTPNGDGKNDRFIIRNIDMYPNNTVRIYDRAGRLLFSKVNYKDEFDGTFQGSPLAEDTYYYIVDFGPTKLKLKGFITIVRD